MAASKSKRRGGTRQRRRACGAAVSVRVLGAGSGAGPLVLNRLGRSRHQRRSSPFANRSHASGRINAGAVRLKRCVNEKLCWNTRGRIADLNVKARRKQAAFERNACRNVALAERRQCNAAWGVFDSDWAATVGNRGK